MHHDTEAPIDTTNHGVFFLNSKIRYEEIGDGSSQTLFVGEHKYNATDFGWASGTSSSLRNAGHSINEPVNRSVLPVSNLPPGMTKGGVDDPSNDPTITPDPTATKSAAKPAGSPEKPTPPVGGFSSFHPGGANFVFGDGSVRFLKSSLSPRIFQLLSNRNDGEMISGDTY